MFGPRGVQEAMGADDKKSNERDQSRSLERDRGKRCIRHRSASPSPPKQRRKRSRSPGAEEKHRHKISAERHGDRKGHELSNKSTERISEEDNGREVARKSGEENHEKAGVKKSRKEDRKAKLHLSGDLSEDAYSDSESDRARKKKSRHKYHTSRKSQNKRQRHVRSESEQDESHTKGTSRESSEDLEDRANRRKQLKRKKKAEHHKRKEERRRKEKKREVKEKEREEEKRKRKENKEKMEKRAKGPIIHEVGDCLEGDSMHGEASNVDPILEPKHKIFLSHSGAQKEFVEHLCKALEDRCHYPFFDRRHESLPKGERFAELIVQAVEQCEMLIVVVSNEYFMSKWPMIELNAFVQAHKLNQGLKIGPKILPLFYGLSVSDLDNEGMQKKWFQKWKSLAKVDPRNRIDLSEWKGAFYTLKSFNGLSYDRSLKEVLAYEDKIVSHVCKSIASDIKWDDSHVQGKSTICEVIDEKIEGLGVSKKYQVKVLGIYGVGGIGKTTTCKLLCNELSSKYEGKVCHIEFPSVPPFESKEMLQKVVMGLTKKSMEVIQALDGGQCKDVLRKSLSIQRTFLAIDNISDSYESILEAKTLLEVPYQKDSLVVVTARSQSVLERLGLDEDACFEMPDLGEVDAMNLFLYYAIGGKQFFGVQERNDIMTCIRRCYFSKGNGQGHHYHPLALQALGLQLGLYGGDPCDWVKKLPQVYSFNDFPSENPVFDILRGSFDMLAREDQTLFMDIGFFANLDHISPYAKIGLLCTFYKEDEGAILCRVDRLKRKGLVYDVLCSGEISMHDLYLEFAKLEASGSFQKSLNLWEPMWLHVENGDFSAFEGNFWQKLRRLSIGIYYQDTFLDSPGASRIEGLESLKWDSFSHVQVLHLSGIRWKHGVWNLEGLIQLRFLHLWNVYEIDGVEGLDKLKHLIVFKWSNDIYDSQFMCSCVVGQLPSSLKHLKIWRIKVEIKSNVLAQCNNLSKLELSHIEVCSLDLNNCSSLESVKLFYLWKLKSVLINTIQDLFISQCKDLVDIRRIDQLIHLKELTISECPKWKVPSLLALTKLQVLDIYGQCRLLASTNDCFPHQIRELYWKEIQISEGLNLIGFNQLEVLDLSESNRLKSLARVGDLPALQRLILYQCKYLLRLPTLNMSRNLKELQLDGCLALELHEEDIQMLCELPMLQPMPFSNVGESNKCRLDCARKKMLVHLSSSFPLDTWELWKTTEWQEHELGPPPWKIERYSPMMFD